MFIAARDTRREGMLVGGTNKKHMVTYQVDPKEDALEVSQTQATGITACVCYSSLLLCAGQ